MKDLKGKVLENNADAQLWLDLLNKPNEYQTGAQFFELAQKYYDVVGACYIRKNYGERIFKSNVVPSSLEILRADFVEVVLNTEKTEIVYFQYSYNNKIEKIEPDEIIYRYNPSVRDPLLPESLLSAAATVAAIEGEYEISKYHANVLKNGGKLETIFKVKGLLKKKQLEELEEQYKDKYTDAKRAGRPLFMGGDIENIQTGLSPKELAFLDTKVATYKDLAIVTGVPVEILGVTDGATYANADASIRIFLRETIKPQIKSLVSVLDWRLIPENFYLDFIDPTPEDREETRKDLETAHTIEALSTNEMREKLGLKKRKEQEADMIFVPFNKRPLGDGEPEPVQEPEKDPEEKNITKDVHPLKDKTFRLMWAKFIQSSRENNERMMLAETRRYFRGQKNRVLDNLKGKRKIAVDEVFNQGMEITIVNDTLVPVIRDIFIAQGLAVSETFGLPSFSITPQVERALRERAEMFSNSIINTQKEKLITIFKESQEAGEPRAKLVERINGLYTEVSEKWAEVIARTEVHAAMQKANLEAYYQGGLKIKIWVWGPGVKGGVREEHLAMDGEERGINEKFSNGEMEPGLPNCGCTI